MIVRYTTAGAYFDCVALFEYFDRTIAMQTIRARCTTVGKDPATGLNLYDFEEALEALDGVKARRPHRRHKTQSGGSA